MQKTCKKHGELKSEDIQVERIKWSAEGEEKFGQQFRCRLCRREKDLKYKHNHRDRHLAYNKQWRENNRGHVNEWAKQDRIDNPEKYKKWSAISRERKGSLRSLEESLRLRNMDIESYNIMAREQNNLCAICNEPETRKSRKKGDICRLMIDHCHSTNIVRGLLCHNCNTGIGKFFDNIDLLKSAISYLEKHNHVE
jgi:Recombination endonuclease VII